MAEFLKKFLGWNENAGGLTNKIHSVIGNTYTPTIDTTRAQRVTSSTSSIPNLPKPQSMFMVDIELNEGMVGNALASMVEEKRALIKDATSSILNPNLQIIETSNSIADGTMTFGDWMNDLNETSKSAVATTTSTKSWLSDKSMKMNCMKYVDMVYDSVASRVLAMECSKMVKSYKMPIITFEKLQVNEYNRTRNINTKVKYGDLTLTFYDVKENPFQQFFWNYLKFASNDFFMKGNEVWYRTEKWTEYGKDESDNHFDFNPFGMNSSNNYQFITGINILEYCMDKVNVTHIINPKLTSIDFGSAEHGDTNYKTLTATFSVEGLTNDLTTTKCLAESSVALQSYYRSMINSPITEKMAGYLKTRYLKTGNSFMGDVQSIISSYLNHGDTKFTWKNLSHQISDTAIKWGYADAVNETEKTRKTIQNYSEKNSNERWKYTFNATQDPTSIIGAFVRK